MTRSFGLSGDLPAWLVAASIAVAALGLALLFVELRRQRDAGALAVALSGALATALCVAALLRPVIVSSRSNQVGARVVVLVDRSRSMLLPGDDGARDDAARRAVDGLKKAAAGARVAHVGFGEAARPLEGAALGPASHARSDLVGALHDVVVGAEELPSAVVVVSDGRFDGVAAEQLGDAAKAAMGGHAPPVHAVAVASRAPRDASIRAVRAAGAAVAHQPIGLTVDVGCGGGLACDEVPVTVRELLEGQPPIVLATGTARVEGGQATVDLTITLERAGTRLVEVAIASPDGDEITDNDRRFLTFEVARQRVRLLHVAGRPTYDVRALRTWLKSNASVDLVAFFILRTDRSETNVASDSELALIRFPVEELFTEHLPTFDAVVLQDFNAEPYRLSRYIPNLARYVERGGGFVMVGGPDAFLGGHYQGTELERVMPVALTDASATAATYDLNNAVPRATSAGRAAPMLGPLRTLFGDDLPTMPGSNIVGDARPGALVLWEHPSRKTRSGKPMPLLTLGEYGDGRSVAIAVDGVHRLGFSEMAARVAGRGHGALWDGLLGWLMRDPRFEPVQIELPGGCTAGEPLTLRVTTLPGTTGALDVDVTSVTEAKGATHGSVDIPAEGGAVDVPIGALAPGGYIARVKVGSGSTSRRAFACERGGDEWADSRPDEDRLRAVARATSGTFVRAADAASLRMPPATEINAERSVTPVLPPWVWSLCAAVALGAHWLARRRGGLA